jgi:hypothetical protein
LVIALVNLTIEIESKIQDLQLSLYINSKILLQVVLYDGFSQIVKFRSTLHPLGIKAI